MYVLLASQPLPYHTPIDIIHKNKDRSKTTEKSSLIKWFTLVSLAYRRRYALMHDANAMFTITPFACVCVSRMSLLKVEAARNYGVSSTLPITCLLEEKAKNQRSFFGCI